MTEQPKPERKSGARFDGFVPVRAPIDAYGNGGFRFGDMSHRGSLLALADGMHAWGIAVDGAADDAALLAILAKLEMPQFLLFGTGRAQVFPSLAVRKAFLDRHIGLEVMDTGAACRTYNVLLAEQRPVMAAFIAVD
ncbi:MAG: hypothetical protein HOO99_08870 [Hyphomicrobiaceae bacterium]|nr:hypothetical protein [Hyphomicrobiaceae bacterium]